MLLDLTMLKLKKFDTLKKTVSINKIKKTIQKDNSEKKLFNLLNIQQNKNYKIFYFVKNKDKNIILTGQSELYVSFFKNPLDFLKYKFENLISNTNLNMILHNTIKNYKLDEGYSIDFYTFETNKFMLNSFTEIYLLIQHNLKDSSPNEFDNIFSRGIFSRCIDFFYEAYNHIQNNLFRIVIFLILYVVLYYTLLLRMIGIPLDIISEYNLFASIKNIFAFTGSMIFIIFGFFIFVLYLMAPKYSLKKDTYKALKVFVSFFSFVFFLIFFKSFNLFQLTPKNIDYNDYILKDYFESTFYPRVVQADNNENFLVISKFNNEFYYYPFKKLYEKVDPLYCKEVRTKNISLEKYIISILKNSDFTSAKNIEYKKFKDYLIYNKKESTEAFYKKTNEFCDSK